MRLITELTEDVKYITEAKEDGGKNLYIEGIFLQADIANRNGRKYSSDIMENEVNRYLKESVATKRAFGELGHPSGPQINLDRVSHIITELRRDGSNWIGRAKITETPMGNIARGLIESGAQLGVSSRGMGSLRLNREGINEVQNDFRLATAADIVADPSAPDAFVNGIMEGVEWVMDSRGGWKAVELAEQTRRRVEKAVSSRELEEKKLRIFENYLTKLSKITF